MNRAAAYAANAPLMGVPGASAPPGGQGEWFRGAGGLRLRAAFWTPSALVARKPRGTVVLSPGRTEPIANAGSAIGACGSARRIDLTAPSGAMAECLRRPSSRGQIGICRFA